MSARPGISTRPGVPDTAHRPADGERLVLVCACLSLAMGVLVAPLLDSRPLPTSPDTIRSVVDADAAPWWELTVLPDVGPVLAGEIVRYRESVKADGSVQPGFRAFTRPGDLSRVRGIGPKTVERISGDLDFRSD